MRHCRCEQDVSMQPLDTAKDMAVNRGQPQIQSPAKRARLVGDAVLNIAASWRS